MTQLSQRIGDNRVTNSTPGTLATSGHADGAIPKQGSRRSVPSDEGRSIKQPARRTS